MFRKALLPAILACVHSASAIELETQQVSGQLFTQQVAEQAFAVEVLDRSDIELLPVQNVMDALEWVSGVDVRQRGGFGTQADIGIRGAGYEQTLVLLDGVRLNHPQTGHHNFDIPVVLEDIERIEVVRGPGAAQYGPNGNAGVINLVTRKTVDTETGRNARASLAGGSYGYGRAMLSLAKIEGKLSHFANGSFQRADTYLSGHELDNETTQGNYRLSYQGDKNSTLFSIGYMDKAFGAQGFYGPANVRANETGEQFHTYLTHEHRFNNTQKVDLALNYHEHKDKFYYSTYLPSDHETKAYQARVRFHANQHFSIGYEYNKEKIDSNKIIGNTHDRDFDSFFAYSSYDLGPMQLAGSLSYLTYGSGDSYTLPVLGLVIPVGQHQLYANAGRSVRVPNMNDMYMDRNPDYGNPAIKPEETDSVELGARLNVAGVLMRIALFNRDTSNAIDFTRTQAEISSGTAFTARNIESIDTNGLDVEFDVTGLLAEYNIKKATLSYTRLWQDFTNSYPEARYSKSQLEHQAVLNMAYQLAPKLSITSLYKYETRYNQDGYYIWDLGLKQKNNNWHWALSAANILNEKYVDSGYIQSPGTTARFEVGLEF